jgi:hypothetical protein
MRINRLSVAITNHEPVSMVIPAEGVISTTLTVSESNTSLPTLTSVERIVGRISTLGIAVAELGDALTADELARIDLALSRPDLPLTAADIANQVIAKATAKRRSTTIPWSRSA